MRTRIVAGNWKMNLGLESAQQLATDMLELYEETAKEADVVLCAPFPFLHAISELVKDHEKFFCGAQNMYQVEQGAFTGEVSATMLTSVGVDYVIIGHSERRQLFGEYDEWLALKVQAVLDAGMRPIFCIGETLEQRNTGQALAVVQHQMRTGLFHLAAEDLNKVVIAYEPVWAIGTGISANRIQVQEMHALIRAFVHENYGLELAAEMQLLYGGSVKPGMAKEVLSQPDVDGVLVGGASLKADSLMEIVKDSDTV